MSWGHQFGDREEELTAYSEETGQDIPALKNKPELPPTATEVVMAYNTLSATRTGNGFGPNPISLAEIRAYVGLFGEPLLPLDIFIELIISMDREYLKLEMEKLKKAREAKTRGRKT